jgi:hypothetical protein
MFDCNGIAATKEFMRVGEEIQNPLPATGTDGLSFRDDVNQTPGPDAPQGPDQRDCQTRLSTFVDPSYRDTSNIPGRVASVGPDQTFPLEEALAAQAYMASNTHFGKIVLVT